MRSILSHWQLHLPTEQPAILKSVHRASATADTTLPHSRRPDLTAVFHLPDSDRQQRRLSWVSSTFAFRFHYLALQQLFNNNSTRSEVLELFRWGITTWHLITSDFEVRHSRCVGSITKNFCVIHIQSSTTMYISPISTVGIQLHVSAPYVGHLEVVI